MLSNYLIEELEEELNEVYYENDLMKAETFKCKFKEKHELGSRDQNKKVEYDKKYVNIEVANMKLNADMENLKESNKERFDEINRLNKDIDNLKKKLKDDDGKSFTKDKNDISNKCSFCNEYFISHVTT